VNFYQKHIGDFNNATRHLTRVERSLFSDAIELYYDTEKPLTSDFDRLARLLLANSDEEKNALKQVLGEFFTLTDEGYFNKRCNEEIVKYQAFKDSRSKAGKASAEQRAIKNSTRVEQVFNTDPTNQYPITTTNKPDKTTSHAGACPYRELVNLYHEAMPENPRCKVLNKSRIAAIKARWEEASALDCKPFGYSNVADGLDAWATFFAVCNESSFLTGKAPPTQGKPPFLADIDFLFSPSGFAKCLENKYHREATNA
jgi:uncharacterized protein YdaU (DUF1376 family)